MRLPNQVRVVHCRLADKEHQESKRQYAHVFHRGRSICVARAFLTLPKDYQVAIIMHELGHMLAGPAAGEDRSNRALQEYSGIRVKYRDTCYGDNLEWLGKRDTARARRMIGGVL